MKTSRKHIVSIDLGTSSVRICLFDLCLHKVYQSQKSVFLHTDVHGKAEQDFLEIQTATYDCLQDVLLYAQHEGVEPEAICFSNAVSSLVCLDSNFNPVSPAFTYADVRASHEAEGLRQEHEQGLFKNTACPVHASYWLPKMLWLRNEGKSNYLQNYFCTIKDLIVYDLTGEFITDYSNAVATGLCDVRKEKWDVELLALAGIDIDQLPKIFSTDTVVEIKRGFETFPFPENLKIVLGATDGVLSSLGAGAFKPGQVTTMIGSSGACRIASTSPLAGEQKITTWSYPLDSEIWIRGGAMNSGGLVTDWFANNFYTDLDSSKADAFEKMMNAAKDVPPGSEGLLFLPYIFGERAPIWNENARGVYFGIHHQHRREYFARATIEGILLALHSVFKCICDKDVGDLEIRATGGYVRSPLMLQVQADIFGQPVKVPDNYEGSSIGAAILALKAMGEITDYEDVTGNIKIQSVIQPTTEGLDAYRGLSEHFRRVYEQIKTLM